MARSPKQQVTYLKAECQVAKKPTCHEAAGRSNLQRGKIRQVSCPRDPVTGTRVCDEKSKLSSKAKPYRKIKMPPEKGYEPREYFLRRLTTRRTNERETISRSTMKERKKERKKVKLKFGETRQEKKKRKGETYMYKKVKRKGNREK